jgi:hypothetical protein
VDKAAFRENISDFWIQTKDYRTSRQFHTFEPRPKQLPDTPGSELTDPPESPETPGAPKKAPGKALKTPSIPFSIQDTAVKETTVDYTRAKSADEEIVRMNINRSEIQRMINEAVAAAMAAVSRGTPDPTGPQGSPGNNGDAVPINGYGNSRWNAVDIEFFDPNYDGKSAVTEKTVIHSRKDTYYRDVHVFVERVKEMTIVLEAKKVRKNLPSCLRGTALM